jgi:hypothetical protein
VQLHFDFAHTLDVELAVIPQPASIAVAGEGHAVVAKARSEAGIARCVAAFNAVKERLERFVDTNDIDKEGYPGALDAVEGALRRGGLLITDNMLWSGRIFDERDHTASTAGVREVTRRLAGRPGWTFSLVPIRDGLLVARWDGRA